MKRVRPIVDGIDSAPPAGPLRVTITAEHMDLEHVAVALALKVARSDARLSMRKAAGAGRYVVESAPLQAAEHAELVDRVQRSLLDTQSRDVPPRPPPDKLEPEHEQ